MLFRSAAQPVPELEAVRGFVNAKDQGRITDATLSQSVRSLLQRAALQPSESVRLPQSPQIQVRGWGETLVALIELEHL